ncbi:methionine adenosyltransferase [candidate division NPL-UPA2 bacterium Unc8]|uniref:S-adenosylmethionine synthase n=1 Tax=candidate division NPL-UPA2 bacterium Unc8 TaxID=1980939 RepID=A0A399FW75_UNCN2|nr:S-adenosylmethionine synthase [Bacillota bacterium]MBT9137600.1 S-adenosylmethionine synthase [Bacillota bacterium]MBT9146336.1 S-adenosylmethionine synthase [Bacillota bacterium]RII00685.1 MAG: methionine adenosyltransferase [candidate division NPL-UPA2 bacterium Unc8]
MSKSYLSTSESMGIGHPDKIADQVSDAILDAVMKEDPNGRVACETLVTTGFVFIAGEITTKCYIDIPTIARETIREAGYTKPEYGFHYQTCGVMTAIQEQSPDIAIGVDQGGAGDQGMMFGYATNETPEMMPLPIVLAHKLARRLAEVRNNKEITYLRPDGKTQVTVQYNNGKPIEIKSVVVSAHHDSGIKMERLREEIREKVIMATLPAELISKEMKIFINPTGIFEIGGPQGDTGLTGRKIIADTYGGVGSHGGGAFSGKDPTKVDRSASYMARYIAKNIIAAGLAERCEVQLVYAIGIVEPISFFLDTFDAQKISDEKLTRVVRRVFNLTPLGIIEHLNLRRPIYKQTAVYGHFGRDEEGFTWEKTDKVDTLRKEAEKE